MKKMDKKDYIDQLMAERPPFEIDSCGWPIRYRAPVDPYGRASFEHVPFSTKDEARAYWDKADEEAD